MGDFYQNLIYSKDDVITFPSGIPGFENNRQFAIISTPEYAPFDWLVCVDGTKLRFAIINPMLIQPDYSPNMVKEQLEVLSIQKPEDILLYVIVTINENPMNSTANFIGPIVINKVKKIGKQIIIDDDRYSTQEPILRKK
jgi:flagellar assembly factor FliW